MADSAALIDQCSLTKINLSDILAWHCRREASKVAASFVTRADEFTRNGGDVMTATVYDREFYQSQCDGSARSASVVVPIVRHLFNPASVVDVGCGTGGWVRAFADHQIDDYLGIDGDYVDRSMLRIPESRFRSADLKMPLRIARRFDLACSLEVAEHLPEDVAERFVAELTALSDVVLFSAAIPHQGGMDHINEQWQSYWANLFAGHGYVALDCIRPLVYFHPEVEWWYQQNILVYCTPAACPASCAPVADPFVLDRIHPQVLENAKLGPHSGAEAVTAIRRGVQVILRKLADRTGGWLDVTSLGGRRAPSSETAPAAPVPGFGLASSRLEMSARRR